MKTRDNGTLFILREAVKLMEGNLKKKKKLSREEKMMGKRCRKVLLPFIISQPPVSMNP
jgi:hypothetical protein